MDEWNESSGWESQSDSPSYQTYDKWMESNWDSRPENIPGTREYDDFNQANWNYNPNTAVPTTRPAVLGQSTNWSTPSQVAPAFAPTPPSTQYPATRGTTARAGGGGAVAVKSAPPAAVGPNKSLLKKVAPMRTIIQNRGGDGGGAAAATNRIQTAIPVAPTYIPYTGSDLAVPEYTAPVAPTPLTFTAPRYDEGKAEHYAQQYSNPYLAELRRGIRSAIVRSNASGNPTLARYNMGEAMQGAGEGFGKIMGEAGKYGKSVYGDEYGREFSAAHTSFSQAANLQNAAYQAEVARRQSEFGAKNQQYQQAWKSKEQQAINEFAAKLAQFQAQLKSYYSA